MPSESWIAMISGFSIKTFGGGKSNVREKWRDERGYTFGSLLEGLYLNRGQSKPLSRF